MRVAYADPPYIGQAKRHYNSEEVDHAELIQLLCIAFDAWALSCSSPSLKQILTMCPDGVRVGAWVKPFCAYKKNVNPAYAWEPVVFFGGRNKGTGVDILTSRDWVSESITLKKGLCGAKPKNVCFWLFEMLGLRSDDEFVDLFPGTGIVLTCWNEWRLKVSEGGVQQALKNNP